MTVCFKKLLLGIRLCEKYKKGLSSYVYNHFYCNDDDELEGVVNFFLHLGSEVSANLLFYFFPSLLPPPISYTDFNV